MKARRRIKKTVIFSLLLLMMSCGAESILLFIPAFSATWPAVGDQDYFIDLRNSDPTEMSHEGTITGFEDRLVNNQNEINDLTGSYDGLEIEFTIERSSGNVQYTGEMIPVSDEDHNIIRIELQSSEGSLVLGF